MSTEKKSYPGIDCFRILAALLVVAIHTSPLLSFSETGDFILTRIVARTAVPFFFLTSGFFLISRYAYDGARLRRFEKKTGLIYGAAILLYLPVNLYNHYFASEYFLPNFIKDLVFDGTMYHLWYLPASMLGAATAWYLVRRLDYQRALAVTGVLYIVGLFGDSYYGFVEPITFLNKIYASVFQISDYTRNGFFFAPIFFVLGGWIADDRRRIRVGKAVCGFFVSFFLMFGEGMLLHHFGLQRHDSMYFFLVPCMFFLFHVILHFRGRRLQQLRMTALFIYLIHPMVILFVRLAAKVLHRQSLLVDQSLVHYIIVCILSVAFALGMTGIWSRWKLSDSPKRKGTERAWIEMNRDNLEHNVHVLRKAMPIGCELMAVVKTEAYGHGAFAVAIQLDRIGVKAFAVATIAEGIRLRKYGVRGEILILGYTDVSRVKELKKYDLIQTLVDYQYAVSLNRQGISVKAHLKIDTGMHRLGVGYDSVTEVKKIYRMKSLQICGMYTHLSRSDSLEPEDVAFTKKQIDRFYALADQLKADGIAIPKLHIQSSYGLFNYPQLACDYVRCGIALYGVLSTPDSDTVRTLDLRPVLSVKARVIHMQTIPKGESVGYGRAFVTERDSEIAILSVGYGDGIPRNLSGSIGRVMIGMQYAPIVGRICMDQLAVDVTDLTGVAVGDIGTIVADSLDSPLSAPKVAAAAQSISNELLCRLGARLGKVE
ncbi:MAG: serine racemase VanT catalytic subunit [Lachnospiraceae bacterium]|nr:serine racemase VanT catalytic subunit [Lachnospiraceae bacterium]